MFGRIFIDKIFEESHKKVLMKRHLDKLRSETPFTSNFKKLIYHYFMERYPEVDWDEDTAVFGSLKKTSANNILEANFTTLSNVLEIKEIIRDIIESSNVDFEGGEIENDGDIEQDLSTNETSETFTITNEIKFTGGFTTEVKVSPKLFGFGAEYTGQINLGTERSKQWTKEVTISITPTNLNVPAKSKVTVNYTVKRTKVKVQGVAKVKLDPNQDVFPMCDPVGKSSVDLGPFHGLRNPSLSKFLEHASKSVALDKLTSYFIVENGEIFANVPYETTCENYGKVSVKVGEIIYSRSPLERWFREQFGRFNIFNS